MGGANEASEASMGEKNRAGGGIVDGVVVRWALLGGALVGGTAVKLETMVYIGR